MFTFSYDKNVHILFTLFYVEICERVKFDGNQQHDIQPLDTKS